MAKKTKVGTVKDLLKPEFFEDKAPEQPKRTAEEIDAEYAEICKQIGHRFVQIDFIQKDINLFRERCQELDTEKRALVPNVEATK